MGRSSMPTTTTQDIKTPSSIPGTTDVSRGQTMGDGTLADALRKARKRKGISSTMTATADLTGTGGNTQKTLLGD